MIKTKFEGVGNSEKYAIWAENSFTWKYIEKPSFHKNLKDQLDEKIKIVEAGCGAGRTIGFLTKNGTDEKNVLGIDIDSDLIVYAKQKFPKVKFICDSIANKLPIINGAYDLVTCHNVLQYLDNNQITCALDNFYHWLKKDGYLYLMVPHPVHMTDVVYKNLSAYFNRGKKTISSHWGELIPYYHRVVSDYVNQLTAIGFYITLIDEPEIDKSGKCDKEGYQHYYLTPSRLAIKARK